MKARVGFVAAALCVGAAWVTWQIDPGTPAHAGEVSIAIAATAVLPATGEAAFVGSTKCKICHLAQYKSWKKTDMANALTTLKPGEKAEAKTKHGLDPEKDYSTDASCLVCHTTGYGHQGGYVLPDPDDKKAVKRAKKLAGVGCESCHGPGAGYMDLHGEIMKSKRTYKLAEMLAAGLIVPNADNCKTCHNEKSPTFEGFDFEKRKEEGVHEHKELKQREG